jgi:RNA polymerase sigma factor (TIGR02999 family)
MPVDDRPTAASSAQHEITQLLLAWSKGEEAALAKLTPLVYKELHRLARAYMARESPDHLLQTTALINEAFVRLIEGKRVAWRDRAHFFALAARVMRRILVDFARSSRSRKRGQAAPLLPMEKSSIAESFGSADLLSLNSALEKLVMLDPRKSQIVELRFFGGLSVKETAEVLKIAQSTVYSEFNLARLWLLRELTRENPTQADRRV